jgi:hypothetical protein
LIQKRYPTSGAFNDECTVQYNKLNQTRHRKIHSFNNDSPWI